MGVAAASLVVNPLVMVWMVREALREIGLSWTALARHLWPPVMATLSMVAVVAPALWATTSWTGSLVPVRLVLTSVAGTAVYAVVLFRFQRSATQEIRDVVGWFLWGTALEHREWQAEAADNVRLYNDNALWNRSSSFIDDSCYSAKV